MIKILFYVYVCLHVYICNTFILVPVEIRGGNKIPLN